MIIDSHDFDLLPGGDLARKGLDDLKTGEVSEYALLMLLAKPRLVRLGVSIPEPARAITGPISHALYDHLALRYGDDAYGRYNSLLRRMASFAHALEHEAARSRKSEP